MAYSRISHTHNGAAALNYVLYGAGHTKGKARNLLVGSVGLLPPETKPYLKQFEEYWCKASTQNLNQARRIVVSFSPNELPPEDPNSAVKALEIGCDLAERAYPGFPFVIAVQNDGRGGKVHIHAVSCNVSYEPHHKGFSREQTSHNYLKKNVDEVCKEYFELDNGRTAKDKVSQAERRKRYENELIEEENKSLAPDEQKSLKYIWRDDLKSRVKNAMKNAKSREDFLEQLTLNGVEGEYRSTKKAGDFIIYELTDISGFPADEKIPSNLKSKSYKMGTDYDLGAIDESIKANTSNDYQAVDIPEVDEEIQAEAEEFLQWCNENGVSYMRDGEMDLDAYEAAHAQYDLRNAAEYIAEDVASISNEISEPILVSADDKESADIEYKYHSKKLKGKNKVVPNVPTISENNSDNEAEMELSRKRQIMVKKLKEDREEIDLSKEINVEEIEDLRRKNL